MENRSFITPKIYVMPLLQGTDILVASAQPKFGPNGNTSAMDAKQSIFRNFDNFDDFGEEERFEN